MATSGTFSPVMFLAVSADFYIFAMALLKSHFAQSGLSDFNFLDLAATGLFDLNNGD